MSKKDFSKKDAYYFSHDANAQDDPKCMVLIDQLGMEGYGIFWALVEKLRAEKEYKLPLMTLESFARRWGTSKEKVNTVVKNFGLFVIENDEFFYSQRLKFSMELKSEKATISINARWAKNKGLEIDTNVLPTNTSVIRNDTIKVKESKVKESKDSFSEMLSPYIQELNSEYDNFFSYWTEKNSRGKERWESEKFFDISRRINTWMQRSSNFKKPSTNSEPAPGKMTKGLLQQQEIYNELLEQIENGTYVNPFSRK
jgi:hypothetical protein